MKLLPGLAICILIVTTGCASNDQKTVDLVLDNNNQNLRVIHPPNDKVKAMLAAKGITVKGICPPHWTTGGFFIEPDKTQITACVPANAYMGAKPQLDYENSGEHSGFDADFGK